MEHNDMCAKNLKGSTYVITTSVVNISTNHTRRTVYCQI